MLHTLSKFDGDLLVVKINLGLQDNPLAEGGMTHAHPGLEASLEQVRVELSHVVCSVGSLDPGLETRHVAVDEIGR